MRSLFLLLFLLPVATHAQYIPPDELEESYTDKVTNQSTKCTYWHVLRRATMRNPLSIWYRVSAIDNTRHYLELKVTMGGDGFLVARNQPLDLFLLGGKAVTLYNSQYTHSCKGCGNRHDNGDKQGVTLTYPIPDEDFKLLRNAFVDRIRLHYEGKYIGADIHGSNGDLFREQMDLVFHAHEN